jgi:hypothetical protein
MKSFSVAAVSLCCAWVVLGLAGCGDNPTPDVGGGIVCTDLDGDQYFSQDGCGTAVDCDDADPAVNPGAFEGGVGGESCTDGLDNDCDGLVDENDPGCVDCTDNDGDGYGSPASEACRFSQRDCDDSNPNVNPGVREISGNGIDDDCNPVTPTWGTPLSTVAADRSSAIANALLFLILPAGIVLLWRRSGKRR